MALAVALTPLPVASTGDMEPTVLTVATLTGLQEPESNWLLCNGATITNTGKYAALYALLGSNYGAPGKLPSLIDGVQPVAKGGTKYTSLGASDGAINVALGVTQISPHTHAYNNESAEVNVGSFGWCDFSDPPGTGDGGFDSFIYTMDAAGGGGSHNNMPPYLVIEAMLVRL